jgi:putative transposase
MSRYRRSVTGSTYFFTVVVHRRRPIFYNPAIRSSLAQAIRFVRETRPFVIDAWILLPDHLHCIWTLPEGDVDYSTRWSMIKRYVSSGDGRRLHDSRLSTPSRTKRRESTIWQRRFWEHQIRDENDFERHMDYLHFNPVKHGYVEQVRDWPHSTFHRYVREETYPVDWGGYAGLAELLIE